MTTLHLIKCDACERQAPTDDADDWFVVKQIIATQKRYVELNKQVEDRGQSELMFAELCSLRCLASWATNAEITKGMEDR